MNFLLFASALAALLLPTPHTLSAQALGSAPDDLARYPIATARLAGTRAAATHRLAVDQQSRLARTEAATDQQLAHLAKQLTQTFYHNQMAEFAALFAEQATFITIDGIVLEGRPRIVDAHALLAKYAIDPTVPLKLREPVVKRLSPETAVVYSVWEGLVFKRADGSKGPYQSGYLTLVFQKQQAQWLVLSATNAFSGKANFDLTPMSPELAKQFVPQH